MENFPTPLPPNGLIPRKAWLQLKSFGQNKSVQFGVLALLMALVLSDDFFFGLSVGRSRQYAASMIPLDESTDETATWEETEETPKPKKASYKKNKKQVENLANEATATGAALSGQEKKAAEELSNLIFLLNPDYVRRKDVAPEVIRQKYDRCVTYIRQFLPVAREQARKHNIPVSITLAQGLLESNAGESRLAQKANNHFGIKCFSRTCRKGHCMNATDDSHKDFFVIYGNGTESFRARSAFLTKERYQHLLKLRRTQYKAWAHGLKKAGYATDPRYAEKLIQIIEGLHLYVYDSKAE